jgi:hypothetical protein
VPHSHGILYTHHLLGISNWPNYRYTQWDTDVNWTVQICLADDVACDCSMLHRQNEHFYKYAIRSASTVCHEVCLKTKSTQYAREGHKICWKELNVFQTKLNTTYRKYKEFSHVSDGSSVQPTKHGQQSHLDSIIVIVCVCVCVCQSRKLRLTTVGDPPC